MPVHTSRPIAANGIPLREFFTNWIEQLEDFQNERDRRYEDRWKDADRRYTEKFGALEKGVEAAFAASEKAISKAETATEKRFDAVNEFRGTLADQASNLLPRAEAEQRFRSQDARFDEFRNALGKLEVWQGERSGSHAQDARQSGQTNWLVGAFIAGFALIVSAASVAIAVVTR